MVILFQNQFLKRNHVPIDIEDRGYQFGDGVYEVIRLYQGRFFCLDEHLTRFQRSAEEIGITLPYPIKQLTVYLQELREKNELQDGNIYLQISRGTAPRSHPFPQEAQPIVVAYTQPAPRPTQQMETGIATITLDDIRWLRCDIKSLNLLGAVLAKQKAVEAGCQEAIQHRNGLITEGSSTNVFLVKNGVLYTHPQDNLILHGITRKVVLELAEDLAIPVQETENHLDDLAQAEEVFITSTTMEVTPVITIDGNPVGTGSPGPVTRRLQQAFTEKIHAIQS